MLNSVSSAEVSAEVRISNIHFACFNNEAELRKQIVSQLGTTVVSQKSDFSIGYFSGQTKIWINDGNDLHHVWQLIKKSPSTMLWCDGRQQKRAHQSSQLVMCLNQRNKQAKKNRALKKHGTAYTVRRNDRCGYS